MGFAPTWLRQVSPPASHDHFNQALYQVYGLFLSMSVLGGRRIHRAYDIRQQLPAVGCIDLQQTLQRFRGTVERRVTWSMTYLNFERTI